MVSEKSSIGEISSKISVRPDFWETSSPASRRRWTTSCHASLPTSQSKLSVWSERSCGTSSGSEIFAKEMRREPAEVTEPEVVRAAKRCPSTVTLRDRRRPTTKPATGQAGEHLRADAKEQATARAQPPQTPVSERRGGVGVDHELPRRSGQAPAGPGHVSSPETSQSPSTFSMVTVTQFLYT